MASNSASLAPARWLRFTLGRFVSNTSRTGVSESDCGTGDACRRGGGSPARFVAVDVEEADAGTWVDIRGAGPSVQGGF